METEEESDSLDILPLLHMPLRSQRLQRARMLKNIRLESVVEMFSNTGGGSGQIDCNKVYTYFDWPEGFKHPDQKLLTSLGKLPSFDVYSSRLVIRSLGINTSNIPSLELSVHKKYQLDQHMRPFTVPRMRQMLGSNHNEPMEFAQLIDMIRNPDKPGLLENLIIMSEKLHIELLDLPKMLEDYADTFLSVAYYQELLDGLLPRIDRFLDELQQLQAMQDMRHDLSFLREAKGLELLLEKIVAGMTARFEVF
ncbi:MAG: hypothetical protein EXR08_04220 [Alphaproteobacteria bacterium]|nr:hypothetical protein [Alphaproteobacteria bacterium]